MQKIFVFLLLLLSALPGHCGGKPEDKHTFTQKDIFQSAYFLKNIPGLITDYKGHPIRYFADHDGVTVFFTDEGPVYKLTQKENKKLKEGDNKKQKQEEEEQEEGLKIKTHTSYILAKWLDANPHPRIEAIGQNSGYYTFLAGKTNKDLHSLITNGYGKIIYHDLYPGIDIEYSFPDKGGMKYNIIVRPGADVGKVKIKYKGTVKNLIMDNDGNITIHTGTGDIMEHAPVSYEEEGSPVISSYHLERGVFMFSFPTGYDPNHTLIIDPWVTLVTQLTIRNFGSSVDYDIAGDLYVYGAGASNALDLINYQKLAKFDPSGNLLWVFMGSVPAIGWNTVSSGSNDDLLSNIKVDKTSNKVYVGQATDINFGAQAIRLTSAGVYDNFITSQIYHFREIWSIIADCYTGSILALGGGTNSRINMGGINQLSGAVDTINFTGLAGTSQDIVSGAYDGYGNLYVVFASGPLGTPALNNMIYKVNNSYNGYIWTSPDIVNSFVEYKNLPGFDNINGSSNNFNALAANGSYLYCYDGENLAAFDLANGNTVGSANSLPYNPLCQGGIAVDNCNHIYLGGIGVIKTFTFNGSIFTAGADIPLGAGFSGDTVNDVRYDASSNLLYVAGSRIAGTYVATLSGNCVAVNTNFTDTVVTVCSEAIVKVIPAAGLVNPVFSYLWEDSAGNIISQTVPDTVLSDTIYGIGLGHYTVKVQLNLNCGGNISTDSFTVVCSNGLTHTPDTTVCSGESVTLSATGTPNGGTYIWMPGGVTSSSFTITPAASTLYTVTYTPVSGLPIMDSVYVTVVNPATITVNDTSVCAGQNATLTAIPSISGGTYSWSPGGVTTAGIIVSPSSTSTYTVTYNLSGCSTVDSGTVTVIPVPVLSVNDTAICFGQSVDLTAMPSLVGGTYDWSPGGNTTASIMVSPALTTTYTVTYSLSGCSAVDSGIVTVTPLPTLTVTDTNICFGRSAPLNATPSIAGGSYLWAPGGNTTPSIIVSPTSLSTYSVTYHLSGCSVVDSGTVSVNPQPTVSVNDSTICQGQSATLTAITSPPGGTYSWSPGGYTTSDITVSPSGNSTYTVTYNLSGCIALDSGAVTVTPIPTFSVSNAAICAGESATLIATPSFAGGTYSWAPGGATTQTITVSPATTVTFTVTYTTNCGSVVDSGTITVSPRPTLTVNDSTICQGQSATLTARPSLPGGTYSWSPGGNTTQSIAVNPISSAAYTVTYTLSGCTSIDSGIVTVMPLPGLTVANAEICAGESTILTAVPTLPGGNYSWSPGGNTNVSITVSPVTNTTYIVTYSLSVCTAIDSATVTVTIPPTLSVTDTTICISQNATLIATPSQSGGTYSWSPGGEATQSIIVSPATSTTYTVSYQLLPCPSVSDTGSVIVTLPPTILVSEKNADCTFPDGSLWAIANGGTVPYTYLWSNAAHTAGDTLNGLAANSSYTVTVADKSHCTVTASGQVGSTSIPLDIVLDSLSEITCYGLQNGAIAVHVANCDDCRYHWNNNADSNSLTGLAAGIYTVTATDTSGCSDTTSFAMIQPLPATLLITPVDTAIPEAAVITLNPLFEPFPTSSITSYSWTPAAGLSCIDCAQPVFGSGNGDYQYTLVITYNQGCEISDTVSVHVFSQHLIYVPNSFTPNGDGINDVFFVYPLNVRYFNMSIFDKWGEKIFESNDPGVGWDGKYRSAMEDPGVFIYTIDATFDDGYTVHDKGSISLIR